ncbi:MAG: phosphoenolpyruvate-utilizing N-terminal domain-containing protein, partial [Limisphaerales bacterium]
MSQESQLKRQGIAASGGVCRGRVHLLDVPQHRVSKDQLEAELSRFESAIVQTRKELKAMHQSLKEKVGSQHADIFEAHLMVLEDAALLQETH